MRKVVIDKSILEKEYNSGKTYKEIADQLNTTVDVVAARIKESGITPRRPGRKRANIKGRFGSLVVISVENKKQKHPKYLCLCNCGEQTASTAGQLLRGKKTCWKCRSEAISKSKWKGHEGISGEFWSKIIRSARVRNISFEIDIQDAWNLFLKQERRCALSGVDLEFYRRREDRSKITASLDRIDSQKSYTLDNVQWVHKVINNIKMDLPEKDFIDWCVLVSRKRGANAAARLV